MWKTLSHSVYSVLVLKQLYVLLNLSLHVICLLRWPVMIDLKSQKQHLLGFYCLRWVLTPVHCSHMYWYQVSSPVTTPFLTLNLFFISWLLILGFSPLCICSDVGLLIPGVAAPPLWWQVLISGAHHQHQGDNIDLMDLPTLVILFKPTLVILHC